MSILAPAASVKAPDLPRSSARLGAAVVGLAGVVALGTILVLGQTSMVATAGYNVERLQEQTALLERRNDELAAEVAALRSLDRIEREARSRLNMVTPTSYLYITVDASPSGPATLPTKGPDREPPGGPAFSLEVPLLAFLQGWAR